VISNKARKRDRNRVRAIIFCYFFGRLVKNWKSRVVVLFHHDESVCCEVH
jgi:hypothetical protein